MENRSSVLLLVSSMFCGILVACGGGGSKSTQPPQSPVVVTSAGDTMTPAAGVVTLRSALAAAENGQAITFDRSLDGQTISLSVVGSPQTMLPGEIYAGGPPTFQGYADRNYGKSALFARKNVVIDASALPNGVKILWTGGDANPARVLAVYGDLTLINVTITGGNSVAEPLSDTAQPYTLARGGGLAVWGVATLDRVVVTGNRISGDLSATRDRGAYGGGIYANDIEINNSVISGNTATGYGAAGGGIYSVGGSDVTGGFGYNTSIRASAITGNRVTAQHAYGGGVFTLSGGPRNLAKMTITNSTIARNVVEDRADLPDAGQFYYRGGGVYLGGGSLSIVASTIAENQVSGTAATFSGKPNLGGGGIAATIGDAHVVEDVELRQSIVAGNTLNGAAADVFSGSLLNFFSDGYNLVGKLDFRYILVPVSDWYNLSRKRYPKVGDTEGVALSDVVALNNVQVHATAISAGTDAGQHALLSYPAKGVAVDRVPAATYTNNIVDAQYSGFGKASDDFLNHVVAKIRTEYAAQLGNDFGTSYGDLSGISWYGPARTWPSNPANAQWVAFWRQLDVDIAGRLGTAGLNDDFWSKFVTGSLCANETITVKTTGRTITPPSSDQRGKARPTGALGDIGAIEN